MMDSNFKRVVSGSSSSLLASFGNMHNNANSVICVNEFSLMQKLFSNFSSIDVESRHEIKNNREFQEFVTSAVSIIHDAETFSSIALERVDAFDENCFRLLYQLKANTGSSVFLNSETDFKTYNKILDILDSKSQDLRETMVVDERSF